MNAVLTNFFQFLRSTLIREEGQDLVEYALTVACIAFGAIAGMQFLASGLSTAFSDIGSLISSNIT
jgi:Flp pilus assembly pilin Flp